MKIKYFSDTDTLLIEFNRAAIEETRDFGEDMVLDLDGQGRLCALTIEHASKRADISRISYEQVGG